MLKGQKPAENNINVIRLSPNNPDLNPIEMAQAKMPNVKFCLKEVLHFYDLFFERA